MFDGEGGLKLHPDDGFTGYSTPDLTLSAERGELNVRLDSFLNFVYHFGPYNLALSHHLSIEQLHFIRRI